MKFLEYTPLARVNSFIGRLSLGEYLLQGVVEAYSCKLAGIDKKLSRSLEQEVLESLAVSPQHLATSPVGPLSSSASRRTLIYLILTLSHMYPDYDFSMLRAHHFGREPTLTAVKQNIEQSFVEASQVWSQQLGDDGSTFLDAMWTAMDEVIELTECEIYSYKPDVEGDPFAEKGSIWSFVYFFYNKRLKRILCLSCRCLSKHALDGETSEDLLSDDDVDFEIEMDED